jgi:hypothetical protein
LPFHTLPPPPPIATTLTLVIPSGAVQEYDPGVVYSTWLPVFDVFNIVITTLAKLLFNVNVAISVPSVRPSSDIAKFIV